MYGMQQTGNGVSSWWDNNYGAENLNWTAFSYTLGQELTGLETIGPSISLIQWKNPKAFKRIAKKLGGKYGKRILPGVGWALTLIDVAHGLSEATEAGRRGY